MRWVVLLVVVAAGSSLVYAAGGLLLDHIVAGSLGIVRLLVAAYIALAAGFLFSALATRFAPVKRYYIAVGLVFVTVGVAAALMMRHSATNGPIPAVLLGISLVVGSFGYALRVRGFTEAITGRDT